METVSLYIRNLDKGLHLRIKQEAKEKGYSMNEYILKLLEENDPLE
ncbi:FitA-like ribbon-helix-helix domain-containing protein, partial [Staphylococcus aureus]